MVEVERFLFLFTEGLLGVDTDVEQCGYLILVSGPTHRREIKYGSTPITLQGKVLCKIVALNHNTHARFKKTTSRRFFDCQTALKKVLMLRKKAGRPLQCFSSVVKEL